METSKDYLKKINDLYKEICNIQPLSKTHYDFENKVRQMLNLILKLSQIENNTDYLHNYRNLSHTLGKEVTYVDYAYKKMIKKNAAKLRQQEYENELRIALDQIRRDIYGLPLK